ncbi:hypothetical protein OAG85_01720, partial [Verrucomicrobiales bacterium]|nr:hypothetical protein [Verrucomicrobiales bacterium]
MTVQIKDIDELARAGQMDRLIEAPYEPDENTAAAKEEVPMAEMLTNSLLSSSELQDARVPS